MAGIPLLWVENFFCFVKSPRAPCGCRGCAGETGWGLGGELCLAADPEVQNQEGDQISEMLHRVTASVSM